MKYAPKPFERLVESLQALPSIGRKSAMRLAYYIVMDKNFSALQLSHAIEDAIGSVRRCKKCSALSSDELCNICSDPMRDVTKLCFVESAKDIFIFEENGLFDGNYFVLESIDKLDFSVLFETVEEGVQEVIFALTPSIANDAVALFIEDKLQKYDLIFSRIAQGVPTGVSIENVDMLSLSRALHDRVKI